jgi:predicted nucleotidyltransferase
MPRAETKDDVLRILRAHEAELRAMGIERLDLFGSFARDEAGPESDVDLLAELSERASFSWMRLEGHDQIEKLLGRSADLLTDVVRNKYVRRSICRDLTEVF